MDRLEVLTERQAAARSNRVASHRLEAVPLRRGKLLAQPAKLVGQSRRGNRLGEDAQPGSFVGAKPIADAEGDGLEVLPGVDPRVVGHHLRAVRVVEPEHRGLNQGVGRPQAGRMVGVSLDLDRSSHLALDQHTAAEPLDRDRRGEEQRLARNDRLGSLHVGHDRISRLVSTTAQTPKGQRGRHEPEKIAATGLIQQFDRRVGKLEPRGLRAATVARQLLKAPPEDGRTREDRQVSTRNESISQGLFRLRLSCHRWHTEQLVKRSTSMWLLFTRSLPF